LKGENRDKKPAAAVPLAYKVPGEAAAFVLTRRRWKRRGAVREGPPAPEGEYGR